MTSKGENNHYIIKNYRLIKKKKREFFLPMTTQNSPIRGSGGDGLNISTAIGGDRSVKGGSIILSQSRV